MKDQMCVAQTFPASGDTRLQRSKGHLSKRRRKSPSLPTSSPLETHVSSQSRPLPEETETHVSTPSLQKSPLFTQRHIKTSPINRTCYLTSKESDFLPTKCCRNCTANRISLFCFHLNTYFLTTISTLEIVVNFL